MSLFIDKHNRRKSPFILAVFGAALLNLCLFGLMYGLLAEPLYHAVAFASASATVAVHGLIVAAAGTALSCLLFFLKDKRIAPWSFGGLAVILGMFYASVFLLDPEVRPGMLWLISVYGLPPVLVGNAVTWLIYLAIRRFSPALLHRERKTIQEELREAAAKEAARKGEQEQASSETPEAPKAPKAPKAPESGALEGPETGTPEEAFPELGPEAAASFRSAQDEAMLLYMDDDEESDD